MAWRYAHLQGRSARWQFTSETSRIPRRKSYRQLVKTRWGIAFLVSVAIAISYLDRQTLPVAIKAIEQDIPVTNQDFSLLQTAFLITYALMYVVGGKLMDVLGTRRGFTVIMVFWSLACAGHGLASTFVMLAAMRLLLGAGEGGGFPAATRAVAEWFPVKERSTAMGIMNARTASETHSRRARRIALRDPADCGNNPRLAAASPVSANVGSGRRKIPQRRRVVFLSLLAPEVSLRRAWLRHQGRRHLC